MCLFVFVAAHAQSFFNTADVVTSVRNFRHFSGTAVGIMKGFLGLSGAILIQAHQTLFNSKPSWYLLMVAILTRTNPLSLMWWFVRIYEVDEGDIEKKYLDSLSLIVAAYLMSVIVLEDLFGFQLLGRLISFVLLLVLLVSPLYLAIKASRKSSRVMDESRLLVREDRIAFRRLPNDNEVDLDTNEQDQNLLKAVRTEDFWILLLAMACGMGSGLARK